MRPHIWPMMKNPALTRREWWWIVAALVALILVAFPRYTVVPVDGGSLRFDRWTGVGRFSVNYDVAGRPQPSEWVSK